MDKWDVVQTFIYAQQSSRPGREFINGPGNVNLAVWLAQASEDEIISLAKERTASNGEFSSHHGETTVAAIKRLGELGYSDIPPFIAACEAQGKVQSMSIAIKPFLRWIQQAEMSIVAREAVDTLLGGMP